MGNTVSQTVLSSIEHYYMGNVHNLDVMLQTKLLQPLTSIDEHRVRRSDHQAHVVVDPKRLARDTEQSLFFDERRAEIHVRIKLGKVRNVDPEQEVHGCRGESAVQPWDPGQAVVARYGIVLELADDLFEPSVRSLVQDLRKSLLDQATRAHDPVAPAVQSVSDSMGVVGWVVQYDPAESPAWQEETLREAREGDDGDLGGEGRERDEGVFRPLHVPVDLNDTKAS